ncbi:MAG: bifunctional methionine sulfoxide reductase B/A protein [Planctomycetota bacterium]
MFAPNRVIRLAAVLTVALLGGVRADPQEAAPAGRGQPPIVSKRSPKTAGSMTPKYSKSQYDITPLSRQEVAALAAKLDPEAYRITQKSGTEPAFCGNLLDNKKEGVYCCVVCGLPLFSSEHKFNSGTGWPSFWREFDPQHVTRKTDRSLGMVRTEINCARCGAHLGHVFDDGPRPTGERHCLNGAALKFYAKDEQRPPESRPVPTEVAYFAGGCFWGLEHCFQQGPGVLEAVSGYMQGSVENPTYEQVCTDRTGHAETVRVTYDPRRITYRRLLEAFFDMHDPTQLNRQGPDVGAQYRSGIWYTSAEQETAAKAYIQELTARKRYGRRAIVTQVEPAKQFWPAEEYHQDYVAKTGRACHVKNPW